MGILNKLTEIADKAIKSIEKNSEKVVSIYKNEGVDGFLERADKGLGSLEEKASKVTDQAAAYAKEISKSNRIEIEKAKKSSTDDFDAILNSTVAVTVNTVSTVAKDVAKKAKDFVNTKAEDVSQPKESKKTSNAFESFRFSEADNVSLEDVLKFIGATPIKSEKNKFKDSHGNSISIVDKSWYDWTNSKGGKGAVSFLSYELDLSYKFINSKPVSEEEIKKESINILDQMALRKQVMEKQSIDKKAPVKKISKKPLPKIAAKEVEKIPVSISKKVIKSSKIK